METPQLSSASQHNPPLKDIHLKENGVISPIHKQKELTGLLSISWSTSQYICNGIKITIKFKASGEYKVRILTRIDNS